MISKSSLSRRTGPVDVIRYRTQQIRLRYLMNGLNFRYFHRTFSPSGPVCTYWLYAQIIIYKDIMCTFFGFRLYCYYTGDHDYTARPTVEL